LKLERNLPNFKFQAIILPISICLISVIITIIKIPAAKNYEFSIYDAYPSYFWISIVFLIFSGILATLFGIYYGCIYQSRFGILIILISDTILLSMPLIRGYYIYGRGDVLTHMGMIKDILQKGYLGSSNIYPMDHLLSTMLSLLSNISIASLTMIIPLLFSLFFILSIYCLAKELFETKLQIFLAVSLGSILLFNNTHMSFAPTLQSTLYLPFIIYVYLKSRQIDNINVNILSIFLTIFIVFFHPLTSLMLVVFLLTLDLSIYLIHNPLLKIKNFITLVKINLITFLTWSSLSYLLFKSLKKLINWFSNEVNPSEFQGKMETINQAEVGIGIILEQIIYIYGIYIIMSALSILSIIFIVSRYKTKLKFYHIFSSVGFITFASLGLALLFTSFGYGFGRIYKISIIFSIYLIASIFLKIPPMPNCATNQSVNRHPFLLVTASILLILLIYISSFTLYFSPIIRFENQQVTLKEYEGIKTFFNIKESNISTLEVGISQARFYDAINGTDKNRSSILTEGTAEPAKHFGYDQNDSVSYNYNRNYIIINSVGRYRFQKLYYEFKNMWRFEDKDFALLDTDRAAAKFYDNSDLTCYLI
jgi:hypothetical protein